MNEEDDYDNSFDTIKLEDGKASEMSLEEKTNLIAQGMRDVFSREIRRVYGNNMYKEEELDEEDSDHSEVRSDSINTISTTISEEEREAVQVVRRQREIRECGTTLEDDMERYVNYAEGPKCFKVNYRTANKIFNIINECNLIMSRNVALLGTLADYQGTSLVINNTKDIERIEKGNGLIHWNVVNEVLGKVMEWKVHKEELLEERQGIKERLKREGR